MDFLVQDAIKRSREMGMDEGLLNQATIKVIGVGGAGINCIDWLYKKGVKGAEIIAANTDQQHLLAREADIKILLGKETCRGLGAGGFPEVGETAARESAQEIKECLRGADMVFVCAGLGGGTGTGGAPVIAEIARDMGAIVIGVVTMPFKIERARIDKAEQGLQKLREVSESVIVIDNNRLVEIAGNLPIKDAFAVANELVSTMIKSIVEIIAVPSLVNLDYADVKAIMKMGGIGVIGLGESSAETRVEEAVKRALNNPLLDVNYEGATGALIHVTGGPDLTLEEVNRVGELITKSMDPDSQVIWGARIDENMEGKLRVMVIITGVKSPYIVGPMKSQKNQIEQINEELGIKVIK